MNDAKADELITAINELSLNVYDLKRFLWKIAGIYAKEKGYETEKWDEENK